MNEWIKISDKMPDMWETVILFDGGYMCFGYAGVVLPSGIFWGDEEDGLTINITPTHWMPRPDPPINTE